MIPRLELFYKSREQLSALSTFVSQVKCSGVLFTNKGKDDDVVGDAAFFLKKFGSDIDVTAVYAIKAQWRPADRKNGKSAEDVNFAIWSEFFKKATNANVRRVLLVTGNPKKPFDSVGFLKREASRRETNPLKTTKPLPRLGVAFSPYILDEDDRLLERDRLTAKLATGIVDDVWLQFGGDAKRLKQELTWLQKTHGDKNFELHGSMFVPSPQWLARFRFRPWNGIILPDGFLDSLESAQKGCKAILSVYKQFNVNVLIESQTKNESDLALVENFLGVKLKSSIGYSSRELGETSPSVAKPKKKGRWRS